MCTVHSTYLLHMRALFRRLGQSFSPPGEIVSNVMINKLTSLKNNINVMLITLRIKIFKSIVFFLRVTFFLL